METQPSEATYRSYLFLWAGQMVSLLGSSIAQFVIVWWIALGTGTTLYLSLASLAGFAPIVILVPTFVWFFTDFRHAEEMESAT